MSLIKIMFRHERKTWTIGDVFVTKNANNNNNNNDNDNDNDNDNNNKNKNVRIYEGARAQLHT